MKILIVDDNVDKTRDVIRILLENGVPNADVVDHKTNAFDAIRALKSGFYDLLIVDLALPRSAVESPALDGGKRLLREILRGKDICRPGHIVGLTENEEAFESSLPEFNERLWSIVQFDRASSLWIDSVVAKVEHILANENARRSGTEYNYDGAIVCALRSPELSGVLKTDHNWTKLEQNNDPTIYWEAQVTANNGSKKRIIACAASQMGMAAAASLATKVCTSFKPRLLMMTGICAGRDGEVQLGDIIVANPSWDYGSGKFTFDIDSGDTLFSPHPIQISLDPLLRKQAEEIADDQSLIDSFRRDFDGPKPTAALKAIVGPMTSGAAVRADDTFFESVAKHNRKVLAVEMEAFGVYVAGSEAPAPAPKVAVVKAVSDFANSEKDDRVRDYASYVSARFALEIVRRF